MPRIVKDADVRRDELLDTALALFLENGYDRTSVEQITSTVGVAKGTFYHYFNTKNDLLELLVERFTDDLFDHIDAALAAVDGSAIDRFQALVAASSQAKLGRREETLTLTRPLYSEENRILKARLRDGWALRTRPLIQSIIEQGIAEGVFDVPDAVAMTDVWLSLWYDYGMHVAELFFRAQDDSTQIDALVAASQALVIAQERVLGAAPGTLDMGVESALREFFGQEG
jgi:AcrR family transcriptional regulator